MRKTELRYQERVTKKPARRGGPAWLPIVLVAAGVVMLGGLLWAALGSRLGGSAKVPVEVTGAPRLKVDKQLVELGNVPLGQTREIKFELANVGDQTLWFTEAPYIEVKEGC